MCGCACCVWACLHCVHVCVLCTYELVEVVHSECVRVHVCVCVCELVHSVCVCCGCVRVHKLVCVLCLCPSVPACLCVVFYTCWWWALAEDCIVLGRKLCNCAMHHLLGPRTVLNTDFSGFYYWKRPLKWNSLHSLDELVMGSMRWSYPFLWWVLSYLTQYSIARKSPASLASSFTASRHAWYTRSLSQNQPASEKNPPEVQATQNQHWSQPHQLHLYLHVKEDPNNDVKPLLVLLGSD